MYLKKIPFENSSHPSQVRDAKEEDQIHPYAPLKVFKGKFQNYTIPTPN